MEESENSKFESIIETNEKSDGNLFISSYSNYNNFHTYPIEECNKQPLQPMQSFSTSQLSINIDDFEESFSSVFQTSHESDEYSAGFVRMLYLKYLSATQIKNNIKVIENNADLQSHLPGEASSEHQRQQKQQKQQAPNSCFNKLKKIKNIPIPSKGVFTAHVMQDGTIGLGSWGNSLFFYNPNTEETIEVPGHFGWVKYIIPIGKDRIASCSEDSSLRIWDSKTYECLGEFKADFANEGLMSITQLMPDKIICGSSDGFLFIWDIKNNILLDSIQASESGIFAIMIINENQLMIGSFDNHINVYKIKPSLSQIGKLEGHTGWAKPLLRFKANDLITTGEDGVIKLWDLETLKCYHTLYGHKGGIWSGIVKDDSFLFTGSGDCTIRVWSLDTYQCLTVISEQSTVTVLIELPGNRVFTGTFNNELTLYMFH